MGEDKVQVILTDQTGKEVPFYTKTLTEEFKGKPRGRKYKVAIEQPNLTRVNVGEYEIQGSDAPPPVPDNKPPVVHAGEDQTVKVGATVTLVASDSDEDGIISVEDWRQEQGTMVTFVYPDPANKKIVTFVAPLAAAELVFAFSGTDDKGAVVIDKMRVAVGGGVTPPPEPTTGVLYDSNIDGKWNNKHPRKFSDFDPDMPKPYQGGKGIIMAASGSPTGEIDGEGVFTLSCQKAAHGREYTDVINYTGVACEYDLRFNDTNVDNHTQQLQSRHQEEDQNEKDNENAFGGYNFKISRVDVGVKIELFHTPEGGDHINGPEKALAKEIAVGAWTKVKNTLKVDVAAKSAYQSIELNGVKVLENTFKNLPAFAVDETKFKLRSYLWNRINTGNATGSISIRNQRVLKI
jgi:hypothetical protein